MLAKIKTSTMTLSSFKLINSRLLMADAKINYTLYGDDISPPVRFVKMTAAVLGVHYISQNIDLFKGENKTKKFSEINILQTVPALKLGKEVIADSHAISLYLCEAFDNDVLYPKDPIIRTRVHKMLFFNSGNLFPTDSHIFSDFFSGKKVIDETKLQNWYKHLDYLDHQLQNFTWLADKQMRLCDLCCGATVSSLELLVPPTENHPNVNDWMTRLRQIPCFKENSIGLQKLKLHIDNIRKYDINA